MLLFAPNPQKNITTSGSKWIFTSKLRVSHNLCHRGNSYSNISFKDPNAISVIHLGTILDEGIVKEVAVETDLTTGGVGGVHGVRVPVKPQNTRGKSSTNNIFYHNKAVVACCYQQFGRCRYLFALPAVVTSTSKVCAALNLQNCCHLKFKDRSSNKARPIKAASAMQYSKVRSKMKMTMIRQDGLYSIV